MANISDVVHRFFNDYLQDQGLRTADTDINTAQFEFLGHKGYYGSLNDRWFQYATDLSIPYTSPLSLAYSVAKPESDLLTTLGSSLLSWWDSSRGITVTGAGASSWVSRVGSYDVTQGTDSARPAYSTTSFNGAPGLTFDGGDYLTMDSQPFPSGTTGSEIYIVVQQDEPAGTAGNRNIVNYGGTVSTNGGFTSRGLQRGVSGGINRARSTTGDGDSGENAVDASVDFSSRHLIYARFAATATYLSVDNNAEVSVAAVPTTGTERFRIGAVTSNTPVGFFTGKIRDIIVTDPLTATQATALKTFLLARRNL